MNLNEALVVIGLTVLALLCIMHDSSYEYGFCFIHYGGSCVFTSKNKDLANFSIHLLLLK